VHFPLAHYDGFCAPCETERPLVLVEHGQRGLRAWLSGIGPEDRTLSYCCLVCGRNEHVPLTEAEDALYDATLPTWPDTVFEEEPAVPVFEPVLAPVAEVAAEAPFVPVLLTRPLPLEELLELRELPAARPVVTLPPPRRPVVRVIPGARVSATDDMPLALAVA
jgi:hypothetical protein